jgi:hypothetical protein
MHTHLLLITISLAALNMACLPPKVAACCNKLRATGCRQVPWLLDPVDPMDSQINSLTGQCVVTVTIGLLGTLGISRPPVAKTNGRGPDD